MTIYSRLLITLIFCTSNVYGQGIDLRLLKTINPQHPDAEVWRVTSGSINWVTGGTIAGTLGYGLIANDKNIKQNGYELLTAIGINLGVTFLLKTTVRRVRPYEKYPNDIFARSYSRDKSFPSGHTSTAVAMATVLAVQYHKWYVTGPALLYAACIAYSRMYLGKHYPSDVLAGIIVGVGSGLLGHAVSHQYFR